MKVTLKIFPIVPQGSAWCERACLLNALSIRLWEKYKIEKTFNPSDFFTRNFFEHLVMDDVLEKLKKEGLREDVRFATKFQRTMSKPSIEKHLGKRVPIIVQVGKWKVVNGIMVKGDIAGHFFVVYGYDDDFLYLQNPWGNDHYCKLPIGKKSMIGSFMSII